MDQVVPLAVSSYSTVLGEFRQARGAKTRNATWITILTELRHFRHDSRTFVDDAELKRYFGGGFQGPETDWTSLEVTLNWIHAAKKEGIGFQRAVSLVKSRWNDSTAQRRRT